MNESLVKFSVFVILCVFVVSFFVVRSSKFRKDFNQKKSIYLYMKINNLNFKFSLLELKGELEDYQLIKKRLETFLKIAEVEDFQIEHLKLRRVSIFYILKNEKSRNQTIEYNKEITICRKSGSKELNELINGVYEVKYEIEKLFPFKTKFYKILDRVEYSVIPIYVLFLFSIKILKNENSKTVRGKNLLDGESIRKNNDIKIDNRLITT